MGRAWRGVGRRAGGGLWPEAAVVALAAVLRLAALGRVPTNPYYDAAVRSMGTSWAAFLSGAFEPGRRVAIDKPPVDLWLQVASTRLLGFNGVALLLPEALGGIALVVALMWLLRTLLGRTAALAGGLALAVAPSAVVVARSDTMDAVMAALAVAGAALVARAARSEARWPLVGAGVLLGLAFEVKLAEALLPVGAAAGLWWFAGPRAPRSRAVGLGVLGGAFVASALAWLVLVSVVRCTRGRGRWEPPTARRGAPRWSTRLGAAARCGRQRPERACGRNGRGGCLPASPGRGRAGRDRPDPARARRAAAGRRPAPAGRLRLFSAQAHRALDRDRGRGRTGGAAVALALGRARGLGRLGHGGLLALGLGSSPALRCAASWPACAALPGLRRPGRRRLPGAGVALAVRARPRRVRWRASGAVRGPGLPLATRSAPSATASRCRGAPGRARGAGPPCRASCGRAPSASRRGGVSARPRPARSSPTMGAWC